MGNLCAKPKEKEPEGSNMNLENGNGNAEPEVKPRVAVDTKDTENQNLKLDSHHAAAEESSKIIDASQSKKKPKKKAELDPKVMVAELIEEINRFRANPIGYADKIRQHMKYITKGDDGKLIYKDGDTKAALTKGEEAFNSCIEILSRISPLPPLEASEEYRVEVPEDPDSQIKQGSTLFGELKKSCPHKNLAFFLDIGSTKIETIIVLQLVDDTKNNGNRRNNLIDQKFKSIGISMKKGKGKNYTFYFTFAN